MGASFGLNGGDHEQCSLRIQSKIERKKGPLRIAYVAGEPQPVVFSVHGAIAEHYNVDPATLTESHASTIDYVIASTAG
jgi:hypothetical protein